MKLVIKGLLAFTFAIVVACGFQTLPAHAQIPCQVTSTNSCTIHLTNSRSQVMRITPGLELLLVFTNNDFSKPTDITVGVGGVPQDTRNLQPNQSVWKSYPFQKYNGFTLRANSPIGTPNATVVATQAESQADS
ncbi:hypothetical protein [Gloeothece verrucosa]|uniref:Uncharacterized protein n=1 Tax=Gloeothece verrucosa (strain PCC 7822) TaxID=497965 RepID=E0U9G6_GLOV7|nr:hypothetical protein [Gloeothece verrucosa]ADN12658.1 hypothetical protein Cyan7822_0622 [Gloeothece verrucosa PCC 7822]